MDVYYYALHVTNLIVMATIYIINLWGKKAKKKDCDPSLPFLSTTVTCQGVRFWFLVVFHFKSVDIVVVLYTCIIIVCTVSW